MKNTILTAISTIMLFVPWTILPLRTFDWALESPVAEIMVYSYAAFMIFSGIFSILSYTKGKVKSKLMQVCVVINSIYAVGAIAIIGMNIVTRIGGWWYEKNKNSDCRFAFLMFGFCCYRVQRRQPER